LIAAVVFSIHYLLKVDLNIIIATADSSNKNRGKKHRRIALLTTFVLILISIAAVMIGGKWVKNTYPA
jgi:hypothetical protein